MEYLYKIQPVRPEMLREGATEAEEQAISRHFDYLQQLTQAGVVLLAGRTLNSDASSFGIVIFTADSKMEAEQIMYRDPAVDEQVMRAELYPFHTALTGDLHSSNS